VSPVLSVIIPCYNHGQYIREALQSVALCTDTALYEIIIINDGSTDEYTVQVLRELEREGYRVIHQPNLGLGAARNNAIKASKGKYILPLDSDNRIRPDYIKEGINVLDNHSEAAVVYGDAEYFGEKKGRWIIGPFNLQKLMLDNYIDACAVFRKSVWERLNGYDANMPFMGYEDWDLWLRFALDGQHFYYVNKVLFDYRVIANSMSTSNGREAPLFLSTYMDKKYKDYIGKKYVEEVLIKNLKENKKLFLKLFLRAFFPGIFSYLIKKKKIVNESIL
jgi:glycosyltransferase involved in cell wall biosynthesis